MSIPTGTATCWKHYKKTKTNCSGTGPQSNISGFLQSTISSPKTQQQMEANTGPKQPKRVHCKRVLVGAGKQAAHKLSGTKSSVPSLKRVSKSLCRQNSSGSNRQYYSSSLHKQGRRNEVRPTVCPTVENLDLVFPATSDSKSSTHPRPF